jgi:hypothetical protein
MGAGGGCRWEEDLNWLSYTADRFASVLCFRPLLASTPLASHFSP